MKHQIKIKIVKKSYNETIAFPMCVNAFRFTCIARCAFLTEVQLVHIAKLGFEIKILK